MLGGAGEVAMSKCTKCKRALDVMGPLQASLRIAELEAENKRLRWDLAEANGLVTSADRNTAAQMNRIAELEAEVERLRVGDGRALPNVEHGRLDIMWQELVRERDQARTVLGRISQWTFEYGAQLCPPGVDSYGEGMRDAKAAVSRMLRAKP